MVYSQDGKDLTKTKFVSSWVLWILIVIPLMTACLPNPSSISAEPSDNEKEIVAVNDSAQLIQFDKFDSGNDLQAALISAFPQGLVWDEALGVLEASGAKCSPYASLDEVLDSQDQSLQIANVEADYVCNYVGNNRERVATFGFNVDQDNTIKSVVMGHLRFKPKT